MKALHTTLAIALAMAVTAGDSFAQRWGSASPSERSGTLSREEVRQEAAAANRAGQIVHGEATPPELEERSYSVLRREEVRQDAEEAVRSGETPRGEAQPDLWSD